MRSKASRRLCGEFDGGVTIWRERLRTIFRGGATTDGAGGPGSTWWDVSPGSLLATDLGSVEEIAYSEAL